MEQDREQRLAAAKEFFESLDQFQETLQTPNLSSTQPSPQSSSASPLQPEKSRKSSFTLTDLEEAAADIEQFFQDRQKKPTQSQD